MNRALYDNIGRGYDDTRQADPGLTSRLAAHLCPSRAGSYVDVACGSGNYTVALSRLGGTWTGIDRSMRMLEAAHRKTADVTWTCGDVEHLPYRTDAFAGALCVLAVHHFNSIPWAFREIARIVRGRFVLFTSTRELMQHYWLRAYFPNAMNRSIDQMPGRDELLGALRDAGMLVEQVQPYSVDNDLRDMFLYSGKHRPAIYLDPRIMKGISTFASLADADEIRSGLEKLNADIASGRITEIQREYASADGDYCFIVASIGTASESQ